MHRGVTVLINIKRRHILLEKNPDHLVVSLVTCPVKREGFAELLGVLGRDKRIRRLISVLVLLLVHIILLILHELGTGVVSDK